MSISRRDFLVSAGSLALATAMGGGVRAAMGPDDKYDLVIKGGDVLDPSQSLRGKRDIGIRFGKIEALEADIPAARATRLLDASGPGQGSATKLPRCLAFATSISMAWGHNTLAVASLDGASGVVKTGVCITLMRCQ